jgi:glycosyltransferase involved in cell wall biosynthesis
MRTTLVDVVIPFFNTDIAYTREAIDSVRHQTCRDWRIVLVNDGSTPQSTTELEDVINALHDPRIDYVHQNNRGLAGARNTGIRAANSPFLGFLDSDDTWEPDMLEKSVGVLQEQPGTDVVFSACNSIRNGKLVRRTVTGNSVAVPLESDRLFARMLRSNAIGIVATLSRRSGIEGAGLFDEQFKCLEDKELWLRLLLSGRRFAYLDIALGNYRQHASNMSRNVDKMLNGRLQLIHKLDDMVSRAPASWPPIDWPAHRAHMQRHAHIEAAEAALEGAQPWKALRHCLPDRAGISGEAAWTAARAVLHACHLAPTLRTLRGRMLGR